MGLKLNKNLLEAIERLQNVMVASVTGGSRDEDTYKRLRQGLLVTPQLKDALPRFVRTCGDLSQLWHLIKSENLPTYASRREYIWNAFRPLLGTDDSSPVEREAVFVKGSDPDAYVHIRGILQLANAKLVIIDPYMDSSIYKILGTLSATSMEINILTSKVPSDFALEGQKFAKQHPGFTVKLRQTKDFHDRFVILDGNRCYLLGASIKDAGNKTFTIVPLEDAATITFLTNHADTVWISATPL
jgi:hypothetical protein